MTQDYDLIVVGAGMVGATLALALADSALRIAVLDGMPLDQPVPVKSTASGFDPRVSALSAASEHILTRLQVWPLITERCSYRHMHVWDAEGTGDIHFDAHELSEQRLGHIVENHRLQQALLERLASSEVTLLGRHAVQGLIREEDGWRLDFVDPECVSLRAPLLVAADGGRSRVRELAGFAMREWDYLHHAIVTTVELAEPHQDTAWQAFLPSGPLAFLPLSPRDGKHFCSIVWSLLPEQAERLMAIDEPAFIAALNQAMAGRLGKVLAVDPRHCIPLRQRHAKQYAMPGLVLIGDAAHTIHPLAGQGVNLGLLDAAELNDVLRAAMQRGEKLADLAVLQRYERQRMGANLAMMAAMEGFERLFHADALPLRWLRNTGMQWLDHQGKLKSLVIRRAMGLDGKLPSLALDPELFTEVS